MANGAADSMQPSTLQSLPSNMMLRKEHLTLGEFLGRGGFGKVWKAQHKTQGTVAVKICIEDVWKNEETQQKLTKEVVRMVDTKFGAHVVQIFGIIMADLDGPVPPWIVMEYMKWGSLQSITRMLPKDCAVPAALRVNMLHEMSLGMGYLHSLDPVIIHRDLKLANVFVGPEFKVKIGDLGLATVEACGILAYSGTRSHMPPEEEVTTKLDVFSFGVTTWELSTRRTPFEYCGARTIRFGIRAKQRPDMELVPGDELDIVKDLMEQSWHQEPDQRPTFEEICTRLQKSMDHDWTNFEKKVEQDRKTLESLLKQPTGAVNSTEGDGGGDAPKEDSKPQSLKSRNGDRPPSLSPSPPPLQPQQPHAARSGSVPALDSQQNPDQPLLKKLVELELGVRVPEKSPVQASERSTPPPVQRQPSYPSQLDTYSTTAAFDQQTPAADTGYSSQQGLNATPGPASHSAYAPQEGFKSQPQQQSAPSGSVHISIAGSRNTIVMGAPWNPSGAQPNPPAAQFNSSGAQWIPPGSQFNSTGAQWNPPGSQFNSPGAQRNPPGTQPRWNPVGRGPAPNAANSRADPSRLVTEEMLNDLDLARHIGKKYRKLGRALGLTEAMIQNIEANHHGDQEEMGFQVMLVWLQTTSNPRRDILAQAFIKANLEFIVKKM